MGRHRRRPRRHQHGGNAARRRRPGAGHSLDRSGVCGGRFRGPLGQRAVEHPDRRILRDVRSVSRVRVRTATRDLCARRLRARRVVRSAPRRGTAALDHRAAARTSVRADRLRRTLRLAPRRLDADPHRRHHAARVQRRARNRSAAAHAGAPGYRTDPARDRARPGTPARRMRTVRHRRRVRLVAFGDLGGAFAARGVRRRRGRQRVPHAVALHGVLAREPAPIRRYRAQGNDRAVGARAPRRRRVAAEADPLLRRRSGLRSPSRTLHEGRLRDRLRTPARAADRRHSAGAVRRATGIIAPGLFGCGFGFPEAGADEFGDLVYRVGIIKFTRYIGRVLPLWKAYPARGAA